MEEKVMKAALSQREQKVKNRVWQVKEYDKREKMSENSKPE